MNFVWISVLILLLVDLILFWTYSQIDDLVNTYCDHHSYWVESSIKPPFLCEKSNSHSVFITVRRSVNDRQTNYHFNANAYCAMLQTGSQFVDTVYNHIISAVGCSNISIMSSVCVRSIKCWAMTIFGLLESKCRHDEYLLYVGT